MAGVGEIAQLRRSAYSSISESLWESAKYLLGASVEQTVVRAVSCGDMNSDLRNRFRSRNLLRPYWDVLSATVVQVFSKYSDRNVGC